MEKTYKKYFLAANSCEGFYSAFEKNYSAQDGWHALIIKGGPGTGKSSFMKYIAASAEKRGFSAVLCPCSSDPDSLDGVIIPEKKLIALDGTPPHVIEPLNHGYCEEIINLGEYWNRDMLFENKESIMAAASENKMHHKTASRYLAAAGELFVDNLNKSENCLRFAKIEKYALTLADKYIPENGGEGKESIRFLSGITPIGAVFYKNTVSDIKNRVIIEDRHLAAAASIMEIIRKKALIKGYKIITVRNPFLPLKIIDHIIIPELDLCFLTENKFCRFDGTQRRIHGRRFYNAAMISRNRSREVYNNRVANEMLSGAVKALKEAKRTHDILESYYIKAMDFKAQSAYAKRLCDKLFN